MALRGDNFPEIVLVGAMIPKRVSETKDTVATVSYGGLSFREVFHLEGFSRGGDTGLVVSVGVQLLSLMAS